MTTEKIQYSGLLGAVVGMGIAGWAISSAVSLSDVLLLAAVEVVLLSTVGRVSYLLEHRRLQTRIMPTLIIISVMTCAQAIVLLVFRVPILVIAIYASVGLVIGGLVGRLFTGRLAYFLALTAVTLTGIVLTAINNPGQEHLTLPVLWRMLVAIVIPMVLLSLVLPRREALAARGSGLLLVVGGCWLSPLVALVPTNLTLALPFAAQIGIVVVGVVVVLIWGAGSPLFLGRGLFFPGLAEEFYVRQLKRQLWFDAAPTPAALASINREYEQIKASLRTEVLRAGFSGHTLPIWLTLLSRPDLTIGYEAFSLAQKSDQRLAQTVTAQNLPGLEALLNHAQADRRAVAFKIMTRVWENDSALHRPILAQLSHVFRGTGPAMADGLNALVKFDPKSLDAESSWLGGQNTRGTVNHIIALAHASQNEAVKALSRQMSQTPENRQQLFTLLEGSDDNLYQAICGALRQCYRTADPALKAELESALAATSGISCRAAQRVANGDLDLWETLYPFAMPPAQPLADFHLEEMVRQPEDLITGSHITTWFYRRGNGMSHLVVAGHANEAVCKKATATIMNVIVELGPQNLDKAFVTTGAGLIKVHQDARKPRPRQSMNPYSAVLEQFLPPPLAHLQDNLTMLQNSTGLVEVKPALETTYEALVESIQRQMKEGVELGRPLLQFDFEDKTAYDAAVLLPFNRLKDRNLTPLSFPLPISKLGTEFGELLRAHLTGLRGEMIEDAKRRKQIYETWKQRDQQQLNQLVFEAIRKALPREGAQTWISLAREYEKIISNDPPDLNRMISFNLLHTSPIASEERMKRFFAFLDSRLSPGRLDRQAASAALLEWKYPVMGVRNFAEAKETSEGSPIGYTNLQALVEWHLTDMINQDNTWIDYMEDHLARFDTSHPQYEGQLIDSINLSVFVDSFLRGWPPVFLPEEKLKALYKTWSERMREPVWRYIHQTLKNDGIRVDPLATANVTFQVQTTDANTLLVTPFYMTTTANLAVVLLPNAGIPAYFNYWERREMVISGKNKQAYLMDCQAGTDALEQGKLQEALHLFKEALCLQPPLAAEQLSERFRQRAWRPADTRFNDLVALAEIVDDFYRLKIRSTFYQDCQKFIETYPSFVAEPYLILAFLKAVDRAKFEQLANRQDRLQQENRVLMKQLVDESILKSTDQEENYQINTTTQEGLQYVQAKRQGASPLPYSGFQGSPFGVPAANRLDRLDSLQESLKRVNEDLSVLRANTWDALKKGQQGPDALAMLDQARKLDEAYTQVVIENGGQIGSYSDAYSAHVAPLRFLPGAKTRLALYEDLVEKIYGGKKSVWSWLESDRYDERQRGLGQLVNLIERAIATSSLDPSELESLKDLYEYVSKLSSVDTITRDTLQQNLGRVLSHYLEEAREGYFSGYKLPEMAFLSGELSYCYLLSGWYLHTFNTILGPNVAPLLGAYPEAKFTVIDPEFKLPESGEVQLNVSGQTIVLKLPDGSLKPVIKWDRLSPEHIRHLTAEFQHEKYFADLTTLANQTRMNAAYAILLKPMIHPELTERWRAALTELKEYFIRVYAYVGIPAIMSEPKEVMEKIEKMSTVEEVKVDTDKIRQDIMLSLGDVYDIASVSISNP